MVNIDPYKAGMISDDIYSSRRKITGQIVAVMSQELEERNLHLIVQSTRAFRKYDNIELICTEEKPKRDNQVNSISYLGFFEVDKGGVIQKGDELIISGKSIGKVLGFDETHMPNHLNMIILTSSKKTGVEMGIQINNKVKFNF